jgi:hypothetical protein
MESTAISWGRYLSSLWFTFCARLVVATGCVCCCFQHAYCQGQLHPSESEAEHDAVVQILNDAVAVLDSIRTEKGALGSLSSLRALSAKHDKAMSETNARLAAARGLKAGMVMHELSRQRKWQLERVLTQYSRISHDRQLLAILKDSYPIKYFDELAIEMAKSDLAHIELAIRGYRAVNSELPQTLAALTKPALDGGAPFLRVKELTDPWGRLYQFDMRGIRNGGRKPDVWSLGPFHELMPLVSD